MNPTQSKILLADLKKLLTRIEKDMRERCDGDPNLNLPLQEEHRAAMKAGRCGEAFTVWRDDRITQAAVAWLLSCVFVRFMEDNGLIARVRISGEGPALQEAMEHQKDYFSQNPLHSDREYLESVFRELSQLPAAGDLFHAQHNPLWRIGPSGDGAAEILAFWRQTDDHGLVRRFNPELGEDGEKQPLDTRFLGDLYQDLSEATRKKYALLQTPDFVESFILDYTLSPALENFPLEEVRLLDPTCGSGHFLLGAFQRLFQKWRDAEPGINRAIHAKRALEAVYGVDLNPFAVGIARFRLLVAFLHAAGYETLAQAPKLELNLAAGDSLFHGRRFKFSGVQLLLNPEDDDLKHYYEIEDKKELDHILGQQYHAVVGNPPYITVKDKVLNKYYREQYHSCHQKYSLGVPFTERFFELAIEGDKGQKAGYVGMITANSFMKREFGKKLIEIFFKKWDLTHVIDTSGAYIPGHGTPTVILFGKHREPHLGKIRAIMGIRGEPKTPSDPKAGYVWNSIITLIMNEGSENNFISVLDLDRKVFKKHPISLSGGGANQLCEKLTLAQEATLIDAASSIGITAFTLADEAFLLPNHICQMLDFPPENFREMVTGEPIRDWAIGSLEAVVFPYEQDFSPLPENYNNPIFNYLWRTRTFLANNKMFGGKTKVETGLNWYEFGRLTYKKLQQPLSITFAFVATHNHFVLDRGGKVFNRSAPVIKLKEGAGEDEHLRLLGLLNSSTACFWMKQVFHNKGSTVDQHGARQTTIPFEDFYEFAGTGLKKFPIPKANPLVLTAKVDQLAQELSKNAPAHALDQKVYQRSGLDQYKQQYQTILNQMIALQEEIDWFCYHAYGLIEEPLAFDEPPPLQLGERAFEIHLARRMLNEGHETRWFERHGSTPITEFPENWSEPYRQLVTKRIEILESNKHISLIEKPEFKRRWNTTPWKEQEQQALREWLLDRLEALPCWQDPELLDCAELADLAHDDPDFIAVAELYTGKPDFNQIALITELAKNETVPFLPQQFFKPSGQRKHGAWKETWDLQRAEDLIDARTALPKDDPQYLNEEEAKTLKASEIGTILVPPKYTSADFQKSSVYQLRGKLNVPKERFLGFPGCEDGEHAAPLLGWAGWDHATRARAIGNFYYRKKAEGWESVRLTPLLVGIAELLPWLKQWHPEMDYDLGMTLHQFYEGFLEEQLRELELTMADLTQWQPPAPVRKKTAKKKDKA